MGWDCTRLVDIVYTGQWVKCGLQTSNRVNAAAIPNLNLNPYTNSYPNPNSKHKP